MAVFGHAKNGPWTGPDLPGPRSRGGNLAGDRKGKPASRWGAPSARGRARTGIKALANVRSGVKATDRDSGARLRLGVAGKQSLVLQAAAIAASAANRAAQSKADIAAVEQGQVVFVPRADRPRESGAVESRVQISPE